MFINKSTTHNSIIVKEFVAIKLKTKTSKISYSWWYAYGCIFQTVGIFAAGWRRPHKLRHHFSLTSNITHCIIHAKTILDKSYRTKEDNLIELVFYMHQLLNGSLKIRASHDAGLIGVNTKQHAHSFDVHFTKLLCTGFQRIGAS